MQKNDKSYTFLLSHKNKSGIYIKRVAVRRSYLHFSTIGILLVFGISALSIGMSGVVRNAAFAEKAASLSPVAQVSQPVAQTPVEKIETPDYTRPQTPTELAFNSGGPEDGSSEDGETSAIEDELRSIRSSSNPLTLPAIWPHLGKINNEFGFRRNPFGGRSYEFHAGMDIDGERGDLVVAPANGTVVSAGYKGGYGNLVEIDHGNGLTTRYGHLSKVETSAGATVTRGQLIGQVGSTGRSTGPHLHYELLLNDKAINPRHFLPTEPTDLTKIVKR